ncbi:DUF4870 domain-containing protein [Anaerospora hongkongensis]|uniref:DUF4870 domain-containing protein n=1 Tax=Anaerospora hongkongensis TaxID=244830 RepID=UPI00289FF279|nr:DUF4870 domain-containing protein [Anaerospora hongkongensis]
MLISGEQKLLAVLAHLAYLLGGIGFIIAPLVIFLLRKEDAFVYHHAKQALVAHLAILAASVITGLLCVALIGFLLIPVVAMLWLLLLITSIIAAIKSVDGQLYEYPFIQGLVHKLD